MAILYKYRPYSVRSLEILIKKELYFASPQQLNDPYDCQLSIVDTLSEAIDRTRQTRSKLLDVLEKLQNIEELNIKIATDFANAGVLSLARIPMNVLMWSHYADDHRGFVLGFELSDKFTTHDNAEHIIGAADVIYCESNPFTDFFLNFELEVPSYDDYWSSLMEIGLRAKNVCWAYEEEVRVLRKVSGAVSFRPYELREIIFGLNMPESDQKVVRTILSGHDWKHVSYRKIVRTNGFALDVVSAH